MTLVKRKEKRFVNNILKENRLKTKDLEHKRNASDYVVM